MRAAGRRPEAGDDVDHAVGHARLEQQLAEAERRERRLLGGLQHARCCRRRAPAPSFHAAISSGKFHGMICPQTPTGSRSVKLKNAGSVGLVSPAILFTQPA